METAASLPMPGSASAPASAPASASASAPVDALVAALFQEESARLVRIARWFVDDRTAAEDIVQEAFIRLARAAHRLRDETKAAAYLRAIVVNLARDHNRRGLVSLRHRPPPELDTPDPWDELAATDDRRVVTAALRRLPARQRDCVVLRYYLDLGVEEIAQTLGLSRNSVKTHLQRGLRALSASLEEWP